MKKPYAIDIRGKSHLWSFNVWAEPKDVEDWQIDGLAVSEILNVIPTWCNAKLWCFLEDIFYFRNPFHG